MNQSYIIVIPIFTNNQLHPLHENNSLSALYVRDLNNKNGKMLMFDHMDMLEPDSFDFLKDKAILTPNKKHLLYVYPFKTVYDIDLLNYYLTNLPLEKDDIKIPAIDFLTNKFYNINKINTIIPIHKHLEYCEILSKRIETVWKRKDEINWDSYERYNTEAILAYYSIEKKGVKVSNDVADIFDKRVEKHLSHNNKLFSDYFLFTSAGRPSNSFGSINFAALDSEKRKAIIPENDILFEFDYDAYHVRLIADVVGYKFSDESVHEHLAKFYNCDYQESKAKTFKYLYGGVPYDVAQLNPFFSKVKDLSDYLWEHFRKHKYIETPVYKRKLLLANLDDMNRNKLLNYWIQASETEQNILTIIELQRYLYKKNTKLVLYGYDSFLFDVSKEGGIDLLKEIRRILERNNYLVKAKMGMNFGKMVKFNREKLL